MMLVQGHIQEALNHKAKNTNSNTVRRFWVVVVAVVCLGYAIRTVFGCSAVCSHAINLAAVGFVVFFDDQKHTASNNPRYSTPSLGSASSVVDDGFLALEVLSVLPLTV